MSTLKAVLLLERITYKELEDLKFNKPLVKTTLWNENLPALVLWQSTIKATRTTGAFMTGKPQGLCKITSYKKHNFNLKNNTSHYKNLL